MCILFLYNLVNRLTKSGSETRINRFAAESKNIIGCFISKNVSRYYLICHNKLFVMNY